jgi:hypothetical protein
MHDLQNGGLRRRRGGGLGMGDWDSDDEDEDAEERRRRWELRREEMKRRILEDENLGKLGTPLAIVSLTFSCQSQDTSVSECNILDCTKLRG